MKTHLQPFQIILCALTLGASVTAQATLNPPNSGMATITNGWFSMGDTNDTDNTDAPRHQVFVSTFQMDTNLITYANWQLVYQFATNNGYGFTPNAGTAFSGPNQPVQSMEWYDAVKWCNARSQMENLEPCYYTDTGLTLVYTNGNVNLTTANVKWAANGYRLPTEAEWEKAARGTLVTYRFPWGMYITHTNACYQTASTTAIYDLGTRNFVPTSTKSVGSFKPNNYGLYDMAGNLDGWCWDVYSGTYYNSSPTNNPTGPASGGTRVVRGGAWTSYANTCRCATRQKFNAAIANTSIGFRCVRIAQQSQTIISFNSSNNQTNLTYGGDSIPLTATASSGSNVTFTVTSGQAAATITGNSLTITGVGQVTVTASVDASASYSAASTNLIFMISKATPSVTVNVGTYTYTGSAQGPNSVTTPSSGSATYSYVGVSGTTYGPSATPPTGAGSYTATATVAADANYNSASSSATAFTIAKAASTVTVTGTTSFTYSGSAQGPNTSMVTGSSGAVIYSYVGVSGTTYGPSATKPTGAGSYTVTATVAADANYNSASSSATAFSIAKATPTVTFTGTTSFTYSGSAQGPNSVTTSPVSTGSVTYSYVGVSGTTYGPSATQPTVAGSYKVTATVAADANYNSASSSATAFSIAKATPTVTVTGTTSFTYSGSAQGPNSVTTSPVSTGSVTYSYVGVSGTTYGPSATQPTGAGSYTVTAAVVADANNNSASSSATAFTIAKATPVVNATGGTFTYNGTAQAGSGTATGGAGETLAVTLSYAGTNYGPTASAPSAAGTYTVTASTAGDANNTAGSSSAVALTINQAVLTVTHSGNSVIISWPSASTGFVLQQNSNLATTNWTTSSGISDDGTNKSITITSLTGNLFFRLSHP